MKTEVNQFISFSDPWARGACLDECMQILKPLNHGDKLTNGTTIIGQHSALARSGEAIFLINTIASQPRGEWCMCDTCEPRRGTQERLLISAAELVIQSPEIASH